MAVMQMMMAMTAVLGTASAIRQGSVERRTEAVLPSTPAPSPLISPDTLETMIHCRRICSGLQGPAQFQECWFQCFQSDHKSLQSRDNAAQGLGDLPGCEGLCDAGLIPECGEISLICGKSGNGALFGRDDDTPSTTPDPIAQKQQECHAYCDGMGNPEMDYQCYTECVGEFTRPEGAGRWNGT